MKKLSIILAIMMVFSTLFSFTYADSSSAATTPQNAKNTISISFKVGDEVLKINGKEVKVVKPYAVSGNTLVPLRVITEAFGADVKWEPSDSSITIAYSNITIKLKLKNTEAVINGQKTNMAVAPVAINGTTMAPLRFITENFGAEVSYDNKTKEITVTKAAANDDSIKDFSQLLDKSTKERIGDSYYKWSIELPEDMDVSDRSYTGYTTTFANPDEDKYIFVYIADKTNETLEYILQTEVLDALQNNATLVENKIANVDGTQFAKIVSKTEEGIFELRAYIAGDKIYYLGAEVYDDSLRNMDDYQKYLDSFKLIFTDKTITEDLSELGNDGYRTYRNEELEFAFKMPAGWTNWSTGKKNSVRFFDTDSSSETIPNELNFNMYSKGAITNLDAWVAKHKLILKDEYNPNLVTLVSEERKTINGNDCAVLTTSFKYNSTKVYFVDTYILKGDYRYELSVMLSAEDYSKSSYRTMLDNIANSLEIIEPEDAGNIIDMTEVLNNKLYKITGPSNKWSYEIPMSWSRSNGNSSNTEFIYRDIYSQLAFTFVEPPQRSAEFINWYEDINVQGTKSGNFKNESKEVIYEKGATIYKYTNSIVMGETTVYEYYHIIDKDGKAYVAYFLIEDIRKSDKNLELIEQMWDSIIINSSR